MFYSQFILAKKGPLGTIWIAAHLERKLRKNQVADTDIGVSVDSILFPEVPIALRLSSHLLLGVVRIYSRKVNYLFHDCSEALLKIKQAFRSTAVDLPPEESTAPYHSITLPETFDLDDFELPDSAFLQGNFVDHHVSTRDQITLQDTMEGMAYSTSQFGLDERFGDGDASQIGLDLDEDLFLENAGQASVRLGSKEDGDPQMSGQPETPFTYIGEPETPFTNMGEPETPFTNMGEPETPFTNMGEPETPFTNVGEPETPFTNMGEPETPFTNTGEPETPFTNTGEPETPFTNTGEPETPFTNMDIDEDQNKCHEEMKAETPKDSGCGLPIGSGTRDLHKEILPCEMQIGSVARDLHEEVLPCERIGGPSTEPDDMRVLSPASKAPSTDVIESAQGPSTPGLMEEAIPANVQEVPVQNHLRKSSQSNATEITVTEPHEDSKHNDSAKEMSEGNLGNSFNELDCHVPNAENSESPLGSKPAVSILVSPGDVTLERDQENTETLHNELLCNRMEQNVPVVDQTHSNGGSSAGVARDSHLAEDGLSISEGILNIENVMHKANSEPQPSENPDPVPAGANCQIGSTGIMELGNVESKACNVPQHCENLNLGGPDDKPCERSHVLQPCSSPPNQPNALPLKDPLLIENVPDLLSGEITLSTSEIPGKETAVVQGEESCLANVMGASLEDKQMLEPVSSQLNTPDELVGNVISDDTQVENGLRSSEFPAPETLLSAPEVVPYSANDLVGQSSAAKDALAECEESVDHLKSLSGNKRRVMESTPVLQDGNLAKSSAMPRYKRIVDDIPDDDDILASILVGKRSSVLKMRSTPPPLEVPSSKRRRVTPRTSAPKRKTLLDDSMVLHGDAIRQQLTDTEDIRRIRRKAPCTRPEIWMIQKYLLEDEIFSEPLFTGMSAELTGLLDQRYIVANAGGDSIVVTEDLELSRSVELVKEIGEPVEAMIDKNDEEAQEPAETIFQIDNPLCDTNEPTEALNDVALDSSKDGQSLEKISTCMDKQVNGAYVSNNAGTNRADSPISVAAPSADDFNISADHRIESTAVDENNGTEATPQKTDDLLCSSPDQKLAIHPSDELGEMNDETSCLAKSTLLGEMNDETSRLAKSTLLGEMNDETSRLAKSMLLGEMNDETSRLAESTLVKKDGSIVDSIHVADTLEVAEVGTEISVLEEGEPIGRDTSDVQNTGGGTSVIVEGEPTEKDASDVENTGGGNSVHGLQEGHTDVGEICNDGKSVHMPDSGSDETGAAIHPFVPEVPAENCDPTVAPIVSIEERGKEELDVVIKGGDVFEKVADEGHYISRHSCTEGPQLALSSALERNTDIQNVPLNGEDNLGCQAVNQECDIDVDTNAVDISAMRDSDDFGHIMDDNDTEFLNVDDEAEPVAEDDQDMPSAVEDRFLENSGWSSRTRAVAKYLKSLFDSESGRGRKTIPVDNLLAGKTRKEASRMFFETLVLKTKDYIHVEQGNPFENINIQPRLKLLKSEL